MGASSLNLACCKALSLGKNECIENNANENIKALPITFKI